MDIYKTLNDFTRKKPETYEKDIKHFLRYLEGQNIPIVKETLQGIRTKRILMSIEYYISEGVFKSKETVSLYANAIAEFFKYLITKSYVDNKELYEEIILPAIEDRSYWGMINRTIAENPLLKEKTTYDAFTDKEIQDLILECNNAYNLYFKKGLTKKYYNKFLSGMCIKLIILTGARYSIIRNIKITQDLIETDILQINGFNIRLPKDMAKQMRFYLNVRGEVMEINNQKHDHLFVTFKGKQLLVTTATLSDYLKTSIGRGDLNGIIKHTVSNMVMQGTNEHIIKKLTGIGSDTFSQCVNYVNQQFENVDWNRHLNSKLVSIETYDIL